MSPSPYPRCSNTSCANRGEIPCVWCSIPICYDCADDSGGWCDDCKNMSRDRR